MCPGRSVGLEELNLGLPPIGLGLAPVGRGPIRDGLITALDGPALWMGLLPDNDTGSPRGLLGVVNICFLATGDPVAVSCFVGVPYDLLGEAV